MLRARDVTVRYGAVTAVRGASLDLDPGTLVIVEGPNGAGKTSLLRALAGAVDATGDVELEGERVDHLPADRRARRGISMVPAGRHSFGGLTVEQNLVVGTTPIARARVRSAVAETLARFPILDERRAQRAETLSGGEAQMLAIARALVAGPRVLLVDEPLQGLSDEAASLVLGILRGVAERGAAVLIASPDPIGDAATVPMVHGRLGVPV